MEASRRPGCTATGNGLSLFAETSPPRTLSAYFFGKSEEERGYDHRLRLERAACDNRRPGAPRRARALAGRRLHQRCYIGSGCGDGARMAGYRRRVVFRDDYLGGLRQLTRQGDSSVLIKELRYGHDYTAGSTSQASLAPPRCSTRPTPSTSQAAANDSDCRMHRTRARPTKCAACESYL